MTQIYLTMPQPGETITEGLVVSWMLPVGSCVKEGEAVVELETEKALFEYESPYEGTLVKILANPHSTVAVGEPIAILDVSAEKAKNYESLGLGQRVKEEICVKGASKVDPGVSLQDDKVVSPNRASRELPTVSGHSQFSPYIRRLLQQNNLKSEDLENLEGHGLRGRLTKEDVEAFIKKRGSSTPLCKEDLQGAVNYEDIPLSPIRLRIAQNMVLSMQTIPHAHAGVDVDMTRLLEVRQTFGQKIKLMPLIFVALKNAITSVPVVNAKLVETQANKVIRYFKNINLGLALGTPKGLLTPVIKNCESMSFTNFALAYGALIQKSEQKHLKPADFEGATITFNNFGAFGLDFGMQIIPPGHACVIGMGAIKGQPAMARFFLAFDHRLMDGREAGLFLTKLKQGLENINI